MIKESWNPHGDRVVSFHGFGHTGLPEGPASGESGEGRGSVGGGLSLHQTSVDFSKFLVYFERNYNAM